MMKLSVRQRYSLGLLAIVLILCGTFYLEIYEGFLPCALCVLQRVALFALGITFFFGMLFKNRWLHVLIGLFSFLFASVGSLLSGRQVWLQHLPASANAECGVSIDYLFKVLPYDQALKRILTGSAECAQTGWQFLHLSLAEWSLICFILFILFSIAQMIKAIRGK